MHPFAAHRQGIVERSRVGKILADDKSADKSMIQKAMSQHEARVGEPKMKAHGGPIGGKMSHGRLDKPHRARGGRITTGQKAETEMRQMEQSAKGAAPSRARGGRVKRAEGGEVNLGSVPGSGNTRYVQKDGKWWQHDNFGPVGPMPSGWTPPKRASGGRVKAPVEVNVVVAPSKDKMPGLGMGALPPAPVPAPGPVGVPGGAPPGPGLPPGMPPGPGGPPMMRKRGGRVGKFTAAKAEGMKNGTQVQNDPSGKIEKPDDFTTWPPITKAKGGRVSPMTAGAASGEGRLEKADWYAGRARKD